MAMEKILEEKTKEEIAELEKEELQIVKEIDYS